MGDLGVLAKRMKSAIRVGGHARRAKREGRAESPIYRSIGNSVGQRQSDICVWSGCGFGIHTRAPNQTVSCVLWTPRTIVSETQLRRPISAVALAAANPAASTRNMYVPGVICGIKKRPVASVVPVERFH
jgi:hypothetical protein